MSTTHDARLFLAAAAAWGCAAAVATGHSVAATVVVGAPLLVGVLAAIVLARERMRGGRSRRASPRAAGVRRRWGGVLNQAVVVAVSAAASCAVASADALAEAASASAMASAREVEATVRVAGDPRPQGGDGGWMVPTIVTGWRATCSREPCAAGAGGELTVVLAEPAGRGERVVVRGVVDAKEGHEPVMWRPETVAREPPDALTRWRRAFADATAGLDVSDRGLLRGMVIGDTSAMPPSQVAAMRTAGLAHLTAVSGAHFAAVLGVVTWALGSLAAGRRTRACVVLGVAVWLAAIVGGDPSVVRALAMAVAVALGLAWGRPARGAAALAASVACLVVLDPSLAASFGFAMSVAAVASIVLWAPVIARRLARCLPPRLARVTSVPVAAYAAVLPVLVIIDPAITPYAVPTNVLAGAAVLPVMVMGIAALAVAPASVEVAAGLAHVAAVPLGAIDALATAAAEAPGSRLAWPPGLGGAALAAGAVLAAAVATGVEGTGAARRVRLAAGILAVALLAGGLGALSWPWMRGNGVPLKNWDIVACDVGQGDMLLLRAGPKQAVVIDTGPRPGAARACLEQHGIYRVPLLIVTHSHADHDGGVAGVLGAARVDQAWVGAGSVHSAATRMLQSEAVTASVPAPGAHLTVGTVTLAVLSTLHAESDAGANDASIVVLAQADQATVLALGDLESPGQAALASALPSGVTVDAVKVAHHGSADQDPGLAALIDAELALVTVGEGNRHGHPTQHALALYGAGARMLRTDTCSPVALAREGDTLTWTPCPSGVGR
ncbi:ComEC/Rec2 family competence protein [Demequina sp. NBRC 110053]|uniref:ComEC/Rec2 family competence protein n=1 Tax=Demequina sp. NBRC 110053 TaxID=1570342 RepID=UPI000A064831|nr:ComEC/Rec2 family competence protein [Demequina sp. NBRC 110053]